MKIFNVLVCTLLSIPALSQSVAINTDGSTAVNSAILDVKSTNKGMLIPRMSKVQRNSIAAPATGLLVFQNAPDSSGFYYYDGAKWDWINNPDPKNLWNINGNSGTNALNNFIGTTDNQKLIFRVNNLERMRLTEESSMGISNNDPKYTLDINYAGAAINYCDVTGLRIKSPISSSDCENGLALGFLHPFTQSNDAAIWNYGQNSGLKNTIFGLGTVELMRLNSNGFLGIGQASPSYTMDVNLGIAAVNPCFRNGLRMKIPTMSNGCDEGLFYGYVNMNDPSAVSALWNFISPLNDPYLRIGFGQGLSDPGQGGEAMRIFPPGKGIGIGMQSPNAIVHIMNNTGSGVLPGVMVTAPVLPPGSNGFYTGLKFSNPLDYNDGYIWNYQNAPIVFGTNDIERMRILHNGNTGIGTNDPQELLHVAGNIRSTSLAGTPDRMLAADIDGNITPFSMGLEGQVLTTISGAASWQNYTGWLTTGNGGTSPTNNFLGTTDPADVHFRTNNIERMRITSDGKVGIGSYPVEKAEIIGAQGTPVRLVVGNRAGFGPAALDFVSDYGLASQWRPGYIRSNDIGGFTGSVEIYTNGAGAGNLYGNVKGLEVRNGITYTATGNVGTFSDFRLKKEIRPFTSGLDVIKNINPVSFYYNEAAPFQTDKMQVGIVAQDLEKVAPYMVEQQKLDSVDDMRTVNNQAYIYLLINAVKEQDKKIDALEKMVLQQKEMIEKLMGK